MTRVPSLLKWLSSALAGLALFTGLFMLRGNGQAVPLPPYVTASAMPTQSDDDVEIRTLLISVTNDVQRILGSFLVVSDPAVESVRIFTIDPRVLIDPGGDDLLDLREAGFQYSAGSVQQSLQIALGVRIDATLVLQRLALAGLVDAVGGIDITNPNAIRIPVQGDQTKVIDAGQVHLNGVLSGGYIVAREQNEQVHDRQSRISAVLMAALAKLPTDEIRMQETLSALGSLSRTTVPTNQVADFLVLLGQHDIWTTEQAEPLATATSYLHPAGSTANRNQEWQRFALPKAMRQMRAYAQTLQGKEVDSKIRVMVSSHSTIDRLQARRELRNSQFAFVDGGTVSLRQNSRFIIHSKRVTTKDITELQQKLQLKNPKVIRQQVSDLSAQNPKQRQLQVADVTIQIGIDYRAKHNSEKSEN